MHENIPTDSIMDFSYRLKLLRETNGIKQRELAQYVGVSRTTISGYETRGYQPSHEKLQKLAERFDVTIDYLIRGGPEDEILEMNYQLSNRTVINKINQCCKGLSYENKLKALDFILYLEHQESSENL